MAPTKDLLIKVFEILTKGLPLGLCLFPVVIVSRQKLQDERYLQRGQSKGLWARPSPSSRPSSGLNKAKVQGQRRTTSVSSLQQEDAVWAKNLLEQRLERVELESTY